MKHLLPILISLAVFVTGCGPQGTPTMAPVDLQNTAMAAAWTVVAATQQAMPTATPVPPTETPSPTPLPTFTPLPLATQPDPFSTPTTAPAGDCLRPLNMGEAGPTTPVRIENQSGGAITVSLNLNPANAFGQCGNLTYALAKNEKKIVKLPKGNWWAYAWVTLKNGSSSNASCSFIVRPGSSDLARLLVGQESCHALDL